jgi:dTDP-4-amino-4,6-dideoxygalactose transaminase
VLVVHLYGHAANMGAVVERARKHGLKVLEDCAQAHGARHHGRIVGTWGDAAAFSFYPTKNLGALGDGGMLVTGDADVAARARSLREYGWRRRFVSEAPGVNTRLDELQAAVLRVKLERLDEANARRGAIARAYAAGLEGLPLVLPRPATGETHVWHQYVVRTPDRDRFRQVLSDRGVMTAVHYPEPVHRQPAYAARLAIGPGGLPVTEAMTAEVLSLPIYPELTDESVARVIEAMRAALA